MADSAPRIPYRHPLACSDDESLERARRLADDLGARRTVRSFSDRPIPPAILERCIAAAGAAPSGANRQPWHFVVVTDRVTKRKIREAAEAEEKSFYSERAPDEWLEALAPLGTDADKPFLETAPALIAVFARRWDESGQGERIKNYYVQESVGIAVGFLVAALHLAGLSTLTHTPSPMRFLSEILERPASEQPFLLLVVGHADDEATVPDIRRKSMSEISTFR